MNQHFRADSALARIPDDEAVIPSELQIANNWIQNVIIQRRGAFSGDAYGKRVRRSLYWPVDVVVLHGNIGNIVDAAKAVKLELEDGARQGRLNLPAVFAPSARLVSLWIDSVLEFARKGERQEIDSTPLRFSAAERAQALVNRVGYIVAMYAHQRKYEERGSRISLTEKGRFELNFQLIMSEFLPLVPDRSDEFLALLIPELSNALEGGWKLESEEWGHLSFESGEIVLHLRKPTTFEDPLFELSNEG